MPSPISLLWLITVLKIFLFVRESVRAAGTELIALDENRGIAAALNIGIRRALDAGKEWILTLDDDSFPQSNILETYARVLSKYPDAGLIGTEFSPTAGNSSEARESITIITSGTLHKSINFPNHRVLHRKTFH